MAGRERELKVVVTGEDRGGTRVLKNLAGDAGKVEPGVAHVQDALAKLVEVLTNQLPAGGEQAKEALGGVATSMAEGVAGASQFKSSLVAGAAVGGAALVAFGVDSAKTFLNVASETRKLRGAMGGTAEEASRLRNTGNALNIDTDTLAAGFVQFSKRLETNRDYLADNGVELARTKNGTIDQYQTLLRLGDAYKGIEDPTKRNVFLTTVFGRAGADLRGILAGTREEMEAFAKSGPILDDADLKKARDTEIELRLLKQQVEELKVSAGGPAIQVGKNVLDIFSEGLPATIAKLVQGESASDKAAKAAIGHALAIEEESKEAAEAVAAFDAYSRALAGVENSSDKLAKAESDAAAAPAKAARTRADAAEAVEDAQRSLADAQEAAAEAVVDANRRIEDSERSLSDAHRRQADAQESLNDARREAAKDLEDLRRAQERNAVAEERAAFSVERAQQDIGKAKTIAEERDARIGLREAELSLSDAQEKRREDAEALNAAEAAGVEGSRRVMDAKRGVEDAIRSVGDAERSVTDAMAGAAKAQEQGARSVEQAHRAVRDAIQAQADVAISSLDTQIEKERALRDAINERAAAITKAGEAAEKAGVVPLKPGEHGPPIPLSLTVPGRAHGGPVRKGNLYLVGEKQPELFQPGADGVIHPSTASAGGGAITFQNTFHVTGEMDAFTRWQVEQAVDSAMRRNADELSRLIGASG